MVEYLIKEESLVALADALRERTGGTEGLSFPNGFIGALNSIVGSGDGSNLPDGTYVTFGYEKKDEISAPVIREEEYSITSEDLNELGAIAQKVSGRAKLMTIEDMIYFLNNASFIPQGYAESAVELDIELTTNASGILPVVQKGYAITVCDLNINASVNATATII